MFRVYCFLLFCSTGLGLSQAADVRPYTLPGPLPVLAEADVVIIGDSIAACAAALEVRKAGGSVFLVSHRPWLGSDVVDPFIVWPGRAARPDDDPLYRALFQESAAIQSADDGRIWLPPGHIKRTLEQQLLAAGAGFLFGTYPLNVMRDTSGSIAGVVVVNRSGRQVLKGKCVIDATDSAVLGRLAWRWIDLEYKPRTDGAIRAVTVGSEPELSGWSVRRLDVEIPVGKSRQPLWLLNSKTSPPAVVDYHRKMQLLQGLLNQLAATGSSLSSGTFDWPGDFTLPGSTRFDPAKPDAAALSPDGQPRFWVLAVAGLSAYDHPRQAIALGRAVGSAAAGKAGKAKFLPLRKESTESWAQMERQNGELSGWVERGPSRRVDVSGQRFALSQSVQVAVVGGGTSGAPAGIAAARQGVKTLLLEYQSELGGVSTVGRIGRYWHGYRGGFTAQSDRGIQQFDGVRSLRAKMQWYRREILAAGGQVWTNVLVWAATQAIEGPGQGQVRRLLVATPDGPCAVACEVVIDATGAAAIAQAAGAAMQESAAEHVAVQGTGLPPVHPGQSYTNTDYAFAAEDDVVDAWRLLVQARQRFAGAFDVAGLLDTRERPRIVGRVTIQPEDIYIGRRYLDAVNLARSNFDTHGFTVSDLFLLAPPDRSVRTFRVPLRALQPIGIDNMLVVGLGFAAQRDAMPLLRMQPDLQNQGYAAGYIGATVDDLHEPTAASIRRFQRHLVEVGILPDDALQDVDSGAVSARDLASAVRNLQLTPEKLAPILTDRAAALPLLRKARAAAAGQRRLEYAAVLGILHDPAGADDLLKAVAEQPFREGWNFRGMGQFGRSRGQIDLLIVALGRTGDNRAVEVLLDKIDQLPEDPAFSHCRALAVALETLKDPRAAGPLATLLSRPGMQGHWLLQLRPSQTLKGSDDLRRSRQLRELVLARALVRCGDHNGLGRRILERYAMDLRGLYARHARAVLAELE